MGLEASAAVGVLAVVHRRPTRSCRRSRWTNSQWESEREHDTSGSLECETMLNFFNVEFFNDSSFIVLLMC